MTGGAEPPERVRRPAEVAWVQDDTLDGCAVLLHLPTARRTVLSATATAAWLELVAAGDAGAEVDQVCEVLAGRYAGDLAEVTRDVRGLVVELLAAGLVEPVMDAPATDGPPPDPAGPDR